MEYNKFLEKRNLSKEDLNSIIFSRDLNIYNLTTEQGSNIKVVNHFPHISKFKNLLLDLENEDETLLDNIELIKKEELRRGVIASIYVLFTDNDEIFINYDNEFLEIENEALKIGKSFIRDYFPSWSKEILNIFNSYRIELRGELDSDIRETSFYELLKFNFIIYDSVSSKIRRKDSELISIELNPILNDDNTIDDISTSKELIIDDKNLNFKIIDDKGFKIMNDKNLNFKIIDDMLRIVLDPVLNKNIEPNHKNSWIKISNPSYLFYPYYDGQPLFDSFEKRNHIYKDNRFLNAMAEHFRNHPNRFMTKRVNTGYANFIWIPKHYIEHIDGSIQLIKDIPNNEGNLQIINHFPNSNIIHETLFYDDSRSMGSSRRIRTQKEIKDFPYFLRPRYIIHKDESPELVFKELSQKFEGLWSVKILNIYKNFIHKIFDNFESLKEYVISLEKHKDNINGIIIEKYGESPYLYDKRKFNVQINTLITNDKSLYISPFIFISTSSEEYTNELSGDWEKDQFVHILTNLTQRKGPNYAKYEERNLLSIYDMESGFYETLFPQWEKIILECFELFKHKLETSDRKHFELLSFGFECDIESHTSDYHTSDYHTSDYHTSDYHTLNYKSGDYKSGDYKSGDYKSGDYKSGDYKSLKTYLFAVATGMSRKWDVDWADEQSNLLYNDAFKIILDPFYNLKNMGNSWIKISEPMYKYYIDEGADIVDSNFLNLIKSRKNLITDVSEKLDRKNKWKFIYNKVLEGDWNLLWFITEKISLNEGKKVSIFTLPNPKNNIQVVNHLPNISFITDKSNLTKRLSNLPGSNFFYPKTFIYDTKDLNVKNKFIKFFKSIYPNFAIVKPGNLYSGKGIKIFNNFKEIINYIEKESSYNTNIKGEFIIQEYVNNPLLYQGRKFDIRVYVLVSDDYKIYINRHGYLRTCSEKYTYKLDKNWEKDKFVHITNNSVQKYSKNFGKYEPGNLLPLSTKIKGVNIFEYFSPQWVEIINLILLNLKNELISLPEELNEEVRNELVRKNRKRYFELLGFDFLIDDNFNTKLLEININPGAESNDEGTKIMLDDLLRICVDPLFGINVSKYESSWEEI